MDSAIAVIDASLVVKAILPNPDLSRCQEALMSLQEKQLVAPALWIYEITSTFSKAVHWGQITPEEGRQALHQALSLEVKVIPPDETQSILSFEWTRQLNRASAYDSFYISLAEALEAEFWTADQRLSRAMQGYLSDKIHWVGGEVV